MGSIKNVVTEPIEGHEDYYMMVRVCLHTNHPSTVYNADAAPVQFHGCKHIFTLRLEDHEGKMGSRTERCCRCYLSLYWFKKLFC